MYFSSIEAKEYLSWLCISIQVSFNKFLKKIYLSEFSKLGYLFSKIQFCFTKSPLSRDYLQAGELLSLEYQVLN